MQEIDTFKSKEESIQTRINDYRIDIARVGDILFRNPDTKEIKFEGRYSDFSQFMPTIASNFESLKDLRRLDISEDISEYKRDKGELMKVHLAFSDSNSNFSNIFLYYRRYDSAMHTDIYKSSSMVVSTKEEKNGELRELLRVAMTRESLNTALLLWMADKKVASSSAKT